jgi:hypothetical protein
MTTNEEVTHLNTLNKSSIDEPGYFSVTRNLSEAERRSVEIAKKSYYRAFAYMMSGEFLPAIGELRHAISAISLANKCESEFYAAPTPDNVVQFKRANTP